MKYFYSSANNSSYWKTLKELDCKRFLISYAHIKKEHETEHFREYEDMILDSGAFTVWNAGKGEINIDDYVRFCKHLPSHWFFVNLDVIPTTGSTRKEIDSCADRSIANYEYLTNNLGKNVIPVYHYGEKISVLKKYMELTNYIGISPANDTHEQEKRRYLKGCFNLTRDKYKTHGFGYASLGGLEMFPFYSVDSVSFMRCRVRDKNVRTAGAFTCLQYKTVPYYKRLEDYITRLWAKRGIEWNTPSQSQKSSILDLNLK